MQPSEKKLSFHLTSHPSRLCALKVEKVSGVRNGGKLGVLDMPGKPTNIFAGGVLVEGTIDEQHRNLYRPEDIYLLALIERKDLVNVNMICCSLPSTMRNRYS